MPLSSAGAPERQKKDDERRERIALHEAPPGTTRNSSMIANMKFIPISALEYLHKGMENYAYFN